MREIKKNYVENQIMKYIYNIIIGLTKSNVLKKILAGQIIQERKRYQTDTGSSFGLKR